MSSVEVMRGLTMVGRAVLLSFCMLVTACSGSIYRQRPVVGNDPVAITVDARQRVLLSQLDRSRTSDPLFRRFCAEPSPDVFTVMGVSGSGGGTLGLGADKSVNAALQAAFSSSETGATIARTQTLNMLREMMFRTCERYLSGAISADEFPIVAARDQRIMVSILAIEQLTGSITPRALSINSSGSASSGMDPTEMMKMLADAQVKLQTAEEDLASKVKKQAEADTPGGTCATLRQKKVAGTPALTADETNKLKACDDADAAYAPAKAKRDSAKELYEALLVTSKNALGTSSASTSGKTEFASPMERSAAVDGVAKAVTAIVTHTFNQDETQLFCIRVLNPQSTGLNDPILKEKCLLYLVDQVQAERNQLAMLYGLTPTQFDANFRIGSKSADLTEQRAFALHRCATDPARARDFENIVTTVSLFDGIEQAFLSAARAGAAPLEEQLRRIGSEHEQQIAGSFQTLCGAGGGL